MTTIGIVDDNDVLRQSMQLLLENSGRFKVLFSLHDVRTLLAETEANMPRLLLMDIDMPGINGIEAVKLVKKDFPLPDGPRMNLFRLVQIPLSIGSSEIST